MGNDTGKTRRAVFTTGAILLGAIACASAQTGPQPQIKPPSPTSSEPNPSQTIIVATDQDYLIGPRDVIEVRIEDANELSGTYQVSANGTFLMPYLKRIKAQDKSPEELSSFIAEGLRGRYLKDPQVFVVVKQYYSRTFFIQGAVKKPGVYQMEGHPSLLKLINVAGGLGENHGSTAFIIREVKKAEPVADTGGDKNPMSPITNPPGRAGNPGDESLPDYTLKTVNISGLYRGRFEQNTYVEPGDIVNIPEADVFFVAGEVNAPGKFTLNEGTTLRQAIALSQGPTLNAKTGSCVIFRQDTATGKRLEIPVDIGAVMKGKNEDVTIMANDMVIVPNSTAKSVGNAILKALGLGAAQRGVLF